MVNLSCADIPHFHYWHDPLFRQEYQIPESFLDLIRPRLAELETTVEAVHAALKFLPKDHPATEVLLAGLPAVAEEAEPDGEVL